MKKTLVKLLCLSLVVSFIGTPSNEVLAKRGISLNKNKLSLYVGKKAQLKVKGTKKKVLWKSSKKSVAIVSQKGKVTAKKKGNALIFAKVAKKTLKCKVVVKKKKERPDNKPVITQTPAAKTPIPAVTKTPAATETPAPTKRPRRTPKPTPIPTQTPAPVNPDEIQSIKEACDPVFGKTGTCVTMQQLEDKDTLDYIKKHYSSITSENDMKPEGIIRSEIVDAKDARKNNTDYIIPVSYKESTVPVLRFENVDKILKIAKENGLLVRAHTLVWHSQTPEFFFKEDYDKNGDYVTETIMNARLEMYVRSVMNHVYTVDDGAYKDVVYAWDVVNEYFHNNANRNWSAVYGNRQGDLEQRPPFVKKAFQVAYDMLKKFDLTDKVKLYSNDFNTYYGVEDEIALIKYINEGEKDKICSGIGMQSHIDYDQPSIEQYMDAIKAFHEAGLDVQITEFDLTINNLEGSYRDEQQTDEDQAAHLKELMEQLVPYQKETNAISGFTIWGLCDQVSWRGAHQWGGNSNPTLFDISIYHPKKSYYTFMEALGK